MTRNSKITPCQDMGGHGIASPQSKERVLQPSKYPFFEAMLIKHGLSGFVREFQFCPSRRWRADYAWPGHGLLVEIDGGVWTQGRHTRGAGFTSDQEKMNAAALLGFSVLRFQPKDVKRSLNGVTTILAFLEKKAMEKKLQ